MNTKSHINLTVYVLAGLVVGILLSLFVPTVWNSLTNATYNTIKDIPDIAKGVMTWIINAL
jgi:hypothetical protein